MPKVLLDTNIIIYRETDRILNPNAPDLFNWLDKLHYDKYIHPLSEQEIAQYKDVEKRNVILSKIGSYNKLTSLAPLSERISELLKSDKDVNSQNDTKILNELYCGRVDIFITEDRGLYNKAQCLGIADKVFSIESFSCSEVVISFNVYCPVATSSSPTITTYLICLLFASFIFDLKDLFS